MERSSSLRTYLEFGIHVKVAMVETHRRLDEEDDDGDIPIIGLTGAGYWDFREFGGIPADKSNNTNESDVNL